MNLVKETSKKIKKGLFYPDNKKSLIPNWLSFSRVIGGIAIPIIIYSNSSPTVLAQAGTFIALTDLLDGFSARKLDATSEEGALLDAISDKFFSSLLIIGIIPKNPIFLINGLLEAEVARINANSLNNGGNPKSNLLGKVKIWPLSAALILSYLSVSLNGEKFLNFTPEQLMNLSTILSTITIPLEIINIKQYKNEAETKIEDSHNLTNDEDENKKLKIEKSKNFPLMIFEKWNKNQEHKNNQKKLYK